jgi:TRAP-type C4-dicarboxylate transport system substrate-binding protein
MTPARRSLLLIALLAVAGCGGTGGDKAGGTAATRTVVLTLANGNVGPGELGAFAQAVERESHGTLRIRFANRWRWGDSRYETELIRDVQAGKADLGWVGSRAWDSVGVRGFDALHAPFLIDSYELEERVVRDSLVTRMLGTLRPLRLEGIGVLPGPLRRLAATDAAMLGRGGLAGHTVAIQASRIAARSLGALGARAVPIASGASIRGLDGVEQQLGAYEGNHYDRAAPYVASDVSLWPRPLVIFAGPRALGELSSEQLDMLRRAAAAAIDPMLATERSNDREAARALCRRGAHVGPAGAAALAALRRGVEPVYAALDRDPSARAGLRAIAGLKAEVGAAADVVAPCSGAREPERRAVPTVLDGVYRMGSTERELAAVADPEEVVPENWGDWTIALLGGRLVATQENAQACTWLYGTYTVAANMLAVTFAEAGGIAPTHSTGLPGGATTWRWSRYRDGLRLTPLQRSTAPILSVNRWRRVGDVRRRPDFGSRCPPPRRAYGP